MQRILQFFVDFIGMGEMKERAKYLSVNVTEEVLLKVFSIIKEVL